jgi:hypothetical protein
MEGSVVPDLRAIRQPRLRWDRDRRPRDPAGRAGGHGPARQADIVKVDASHLSMISHPAAVTRLTVAAARSTRLKGQRVVMVAETWKEPTR